MSRKGDCVDSAPMERFSGSMKTERVHHRLPGDEEDRLSMRQAMRDQVGDGLTLASARRADHDHVVPLDGARHGGELRGIRRKRRESLDKR